MPKNRSLLSSAAWRAVFLSLRRVPATISYPDELSGAYVELRGTNSHFRRIRSGSRWTNSLLRGNKSNFRRTNPTGRGPTAMAAYYLKCFCTCLHGSFPVCLIHKHNAAKSQASYQSTSGGIKLFRKDGINIAFTLQCINVSKDLKVRMGTRLVVQRGSVSSRVHSFE